MQQPLEVGKLYSFRDLAKARAYFAHPTLHHAKVIHVDGRDALVDMCDSQGATLSAKVPYEPDGHFWLTKATSDMDLVSELQPAAAASLPPVSMRLHGRYRLGRAANGGEPIPRIIVEITDWQYGAHGRSWGGQLLDSGANYAVVDSWTGYLWDDGGRHVDATGYPLVAIEGDVDDAAEPAPPRCDHSPVEWGGATTYCKCGLLEFAWDRYGDAPSWVRVDDPWAMRKSGVIGPKAKT